MNAWQICLQLGNQWVQVHVRFDKWDMLAHKTMDFLEDRAGFQRVEEINCLGGAKQFHGQNGFDVFDNRAQFDGAGHAH